MPFLAKSERQGGLSLLEHTRHVLQAVEVLATGYGLSIEERRLAREGAVLHDLGKAHPRFQAMVRCGRDELEDRQDPPHRHELSSLLVMPAFPEADWPALIDYVVAHHKSVRHDARGLGLLDYTRSGRGGCYDPEEVFACMSEGWEEWAEPVLREVADPLLDTVHPAVPLETAWKAFRAALDHCERKPPGWSKRKGLLMAADHFASHFQEETAVRAARLFRVPDLRVFDRPHPLYPLSMREAGDVRPHTLVVAPTGTGKTDYLLRRCRGRVFYTLPFQASINAMHARLVRALGPEADVRRVHAASRVTFERDVQEDIALQRHPGAAVKVLTPHQLAALAFGTFGHEALALDVAGQDVVLDEVHVYDDFAQAMVVAIVDALVRLECRVHIGTATIPTLLRQHLRTRLGGPEAVLEVELTPDELASFDRHVVYREPEDALWPLLETALAENERLLVVHNRVPRAQETYQALRTRHPSVPALLVHGRFKREHRQALEEQVERLAEGKGPAVVVATQVVEVSLDVSFDRLVTDAAPLDALVQRFGRVNRRRPAAGLRPVHVLAPPATPTDARPYRLERVCASWDQLPSGRPLHEAEIQSMIDAVFTSLELREIVPHLLHDGTSFRLRELEHRSRQFFLERLEIDALPVVLESDREAYLEGRPEARAGLEITVPLRTLVARLQTLERLPRGTHPFVVPDAWYDAELGLRIPAGEEATPYRAVIL